MKNMNVDINMDNNATAVLLITVIAVALVLIITFCVKSYREENIEALKNGYEQVILPGSSSPVWKKTENK